MTSTSMSPALVAEPPRRAPQAGALTRLRTLNWVGWLFLLPAMLLYALFVLRPIVATVQYSFYDWNGITAPEAIGLNNYLRVMTDPQLLSSIGNSFYLMLFFTLVPTLLGLVIAALVRELRSRGFGTVARTVLFLPQVIPGAAAAVAWVWMLSTNGTVNQVLRAVGLGDLTRSWLGDFGWALTAVGVIGLWINLGFCTILLMSGIGKIDGSIYEAARLDGAGFWRTFRTVTVPGLRAEIGVCVTMTVISALASFDVVFMSTQGGPGYATMVPGVMIYQLGFTESRVGLASALAVVLTVLILALILPLQRIFRAEGAR